MNSIHGYVQQQIVEICNELGLEVKSEYKGKDWRADVMVQSNGVSYAFEKMQESISGLALKV